MTLPTPLEKRIRMGNPSRRPLPETSVALPAASGVPEAPAELGAKGRKVWGQLWTAASAWISPTTDIGMVTRYCSLWDAHAAFSKIVDEEGLMSVGSTGQPKVHPAFTQLMEVNTALLRMEGHLGFTPSARAALGVAEVKRQSALEQLLEQRRNS